MNNKIGELHMPNNLTDNKIKKALECAIRNDCDCNCVFLLPNKVQDVLDLINRQDKEIKVCNEALDNSMKLNTNLQAENERLSRITRNLVGEIKAEAMTEFADKLKENSIATLNCPGFVLVEEIDNLLKEMVGALNNE